MDRGCPIAALKPTGSFWLAIGDDFAAELKLISQQAGFKCRSWVIWYYTFGVNCTKKFSRSHTHLFHFVKDHKHFTFNNKNIRVPSARQLVYSDGRARSPDGRLPDDTWILRPQDMCPGRFPRGGRHVVLPASGRNVQGSGPVSTVVRCPNNCSAESSVLVQIGRTGSRSLFGERRQRSWLRKSLGRRLGRF